MIYLWPGNMCELENLLERAVILETGSRLLPEDFPEEFFENRTVGRIEVDTSEPLTGTHSAKRGRNTRTPAETAEIAQSFLRKKFKD